MVEFIFRIVASAALAGYCGWRQSPSFDVGWKLGAAMASIALMLLLLERRSLRAPNVSAIVAIIDIGVISYILASSGRLDYYGYVCFSPIVFAAVRHRANSALMAPLGASTIFCAGILAPKIPPLDHLAVLAGFIAVVGLLVRPMREIITVTEHIEVPVESDFNPEIEHSPSRRYLELRDSYRSLRDAYRTLERRARKDRICSLLFDSGINQGEKTMASITNRMRELTGVTGLSLYTAAEYSDVMVVSAFSGELPDSMTTRSVPTGTAISETQLKQQFDMWLRAIRSTEDAPFSRSLVLKDKAKVIGVLCLSDPKPENLQRAIDIAEEALPFVSRLLSLSMQQAEHGRRMRQAELMYLVSSVCHGADSNISLASRFVRELWSSLSLDHLAVHFLDGRQSVIAASEGATAAIFDSIQFGTHAGVAGWLSSNYPEVVIYDTTADDRIEKKDALQRRVGSYVVLPLKYGAEPIGFMTAATHRVGGIDIHEVEILRTLAAELSQAFGRLEVEHSAASGMVSPREFQQAVSEIEGSLVHLEPLQREQIIEDFGQPAFDYAVRQFAHRLRSMLPSGSLLCRRNEGDYVVLLADADVSVASLWANQASVLASMVAITTPDGRARVPLGLRVKVSALAKQTHQIVESA